MPIMKAANLEHRLEEKMKSSSSSKAILSSGFSKKKTLREAKFPSPLRWKKEPKLWIEYKSN